MLGTNRSKQRIYVETSRKVGQRYNQEGVRDGTRSDSHLATNVWTNDRQATPRTKEKPTGERPKLANRDGRREGHKEENHPDKQAEMSRTE